MNEQVVLFNYWVDCLAQSATEQGYFLAHSNKDFRLFRQYGAPDVWIPLNVKEMILANYPQLKINDL